MTRKRDDQAIAEEYKARQSRQIIAIAIAMFLVLLSAVLYKRPDLLGPISGKTLAGLQIVSIASFVVFSAYNWRCPKCDKHLGSNIHRQQCGKCRTRLQ